MGLYLYPNDLGGVNLNSSQFDRDTTAGVHNPNFNRSPTRVTGGPGDPQVVFEFERFLFLLAHYRWRYHFAAEVRQRRLTTGEVVLEASRGSMVRACWDVVDRRTNTRFTESATGVVTASADQSLHAERWTLTLHRGDFLLRNGVLEAAERGCGDGDGTVI